ncbi:unnamed protein product [Ceratitis capitata]|uniref:(Mediterranean fruit fly) hypothetical protein n=1 Tax=Ceratitis capitata TaxID=7213 RepID=A0A811UEY1_CERCA|nr:unnamed protein product [Ceratitis capitata]
MLKTNWLLNRTKYWTVMRKLKTKNNMQPLQIFNVKLRPKVSLVKMAQNGKRSKPQAVRASIILCGSDLVQNFQHRFRLRYSKVFFTPNISFISITKTNRNAKIATQKWNAKNPDSKQRVWVDLTSTELDAFIGILFAAGITNNNMQESALLWRSNALPIFRAAMSYRRFLALFSIRKPIIHVLPAFHRPMLVSIEFHKKIHSNPYTFVQTVLK